MLSVIGTHLVAAVPEPWSSIELVVLLDEESAQLTATYCPKDRSKGKQGFVVQSPDEHGFAFYDLRELTSDADRGFFRRLAYTVDGDGDYDAQFEYDVEDVQADMAAMTLKSVD